MPQIQKISREAGTEPALELDAIVIGAGWAGMYMLHRLRGLGLSARVFDKAEDVGGTWFWNRYPGARCDVESMFYSYSFSEELQQEWEWTERYATQSEILSYAKYVADKFELRRDIQFKTSVTSAVYDERTGRWKVRTDQGDLVSTRFLIMATGCLSAARLPDIKGRDSFKGSVYHTGYWPHDSVSFAGKRVAVIGTGSSGIQSIPEIAREAEHLHVFQRTPNFSVPARNAPLDPDFVRRLKSNYQQERERSKWSPSGVSFPPPAGSILEHSPEERERVLESYWEAGGAGFIAAFTDVLLSKEANELAADFVRRKIRGIVHDPEVAEALCPVDHFLGTKRICVDTDYYATYNRSNVTLVNLKKEPLEEITECGIRTTDADYEFDSIVFATGFDAMTGAMLSVDIRGRDGQTLRQKWEAGPRTYLGLMTAGFPNLFMITGPGSPSVLSNMVVSIEQHVEWLSNLFASMRDSEQSTVEPEFEAEDAWVNHVNELADETLYPVANSWYVGANVPGKPRVFMPYVGGVDNYRRKCDKVAAAGYEGFVLSPGDRKVSKTA